MELHEWRTLRRAKLSKRKLAAIDARVQAICGLDLRALRKLKGKTQVEVARAAGMTQGELSRVERRDDHLLSTLRRYVEALGGRLEVIINFDGKRVRLREGAL